MEWNGNGWNIDYLATYMYIVMMEREGKDLVRNGRKLRKLAKLMRAYT